MQPKFRKKLNEKQLYVLETLYRFRFVTTELLAKLENRTSKTPVYSRLRILAEQGYIGRNYDGTRQIRGEYATYYLTRTGINALKKHLGDDFSPKAGKNLLNDAQASDQFVTHWTQLLRFYINLRDLYPSIDFFTKSELTHDQYNYFPQPWPDAYVGTDTAHFFVDLFDPSTPFFRITGRVKTYTEYHQAKTWRKTGSNFPSVLLICATVADQKRLQRKLPYMAKGINFYTAVASDLRTFGKNDKVFTSTDGPASISEVMAGALTGER